MEYKGGISVSHHNIGIDEFERLSPLMDNPRKSKQRYSEKEYYSGIINIMNINGIELQISLFSVDIPDGNL